jgi:hypothetical protein
VCNCATGGIMAGIGCQYTCTCTRSVSGSPGTTRKYQVKATGKDNESNRDTKLSNIVTVTIN